MKFLLQFPTLKRPEKFFHCLNKYVYKCSKLHKIHFNFNCDIEDETMNNETAKNKISNMLLPFDNISYNINFDYKTNKISAINDHISGKDFDIIICVSDDMIPVKDNWDEIIATKMNLYFPNKDGCLHFNDGLQGRNLITLSILGKKLYDFFGYIYHPDYKSLYCDNEFTNQVYSMNKVVYIDEIVIMHEHHSKNGSINHNDIDFAAQKTLTFAGRDAQVFHQRMSLNYPKIRITND